jgi:molybdate transport system substrate-binding protein
MTSALLAALVSAAVSLKGPLTSAAQQFAAGSPGEEITFNFGASGQLEAQIEQGAPADLFVSASPADADRLAAAHRVEASSRTALAGNRLVVVVPAGSRGPADLASLADPRFARVAVGNPKTVPAGRYAQEALASAKVSTAIQDRLVFGENVRQVLDLVARGDANAGIVYATDVAAAPGKVAVAMQIPESLHTPIVYEGAVVADAKSAARARAFLKYLAGPEGRAIFVKEGFAPPRAVAPR